MEEKIAKENIEFKMFQEWWKMREQFHNPESDSDYEKLIARVEEFTKKYTGTPIEWLAREMALLHAEDCERRTLQKMKGSA